MRYTDTDISAAVCYEGKGYLRNSEDSYYATVYAEQDLTVELVGTNTLKQTAPSR